MSKSERLRFPHPLRHRWPRHLESVKQLLVEECVHVGTLTPLGWELEASCFFFEVPGSVSSFPFPSTLSLVCFTLRKPGYLSLSLYLVILLFLTSFLSLYNSFCRKTFVGENTSSHSSPFLSLAPQILTVSCFWTTKRWHGLLTQILGSFPTKQTLKSMGGYRD